MIKTNNIFISILVAIALSITLVSANQDDTVYIDPGFEDGDDYADDIELPFDPSEPRGGDQGDGDSGDSDDNSQDNESAPAREYYVISIPRIPSLEVNQTVRFSPGTYEWPVDFPDNPGAIVIAPPGDGNPAITPPGGPTPVIILPPGDGNPVITPPSGPTPIVFPTPGNGTIVITPPTTIPIGVNASLVITQPGIPGNPVVPVVGISATHVLTPPDVPDVPHIDINDSFVITQPGYPDVPVVPVIGMNDTHIITPPGDDDISIIGVIATPVITQPGEPDDPFADVPSLITEDRFVRQLVSVGDSFRLNDERIQVVDFDKTRNSFVLKSDDYENEFFLSINKLRYLVAGDKNYIVYGNYKVVDDEISLIIYSAEYFGEMPSFDDSVSPVYAGDVPDVAVNATPVITQPGEPGESIPIEFVDGRFDSQQAFVGEFVKLNDRKLNVVSFDKDLNGFFLKSDDYANEYLLSVDKSRYMVVGDKNYIVYAYHEELADRQSLTLYSAEYFGEMPSFDDSVSPVYAGDVPEISINATPVITQPGEPDDPVVEISADEIERIVYINRLKVIEAYTKNIEGMKHVISNVGQQESLLNILSQVQSEHDRIANETGRINIRNEMDILNKLSIEFRNNIQTLLDVEEIRQLRAEVNEVRREAAFELRKDIRERVRNHNAERLNKYVQRIGIERAEKIAENRGIEISQEVRNNIRANRDAINRRNDNRVNREINNRNAVRNQRRINDTVSSEEIKEIGITVSDGKVNDFKIMIGTHPKASRGYVEGIDMILPPKPPRGAFDARVIVENESYMTKFLNANDEELSFRFEYQPSTGQRYVSFNFDENQLEEFDEIVITDLLSGEYYNASLKDLDEEFTPFLESNFLRDGFELTLS